MSVYHIVRDEQGYAKAVDRGDGYYLLHLTAGAVRNEENIDRIVTELNELDALRSEVERLRKLVFEAYCEGAADCNGVGNWPESEAKADRDQARAALEEKR